MKSDRSKRRHRDKIYELLLSLCLMVLVSFAFPRLSWIGLLGYALIALLLTQLVMIRKETLTLGDRLYQLLGLGALSALLLWQITPIRLVERLSQERRVTSGLLMGAAAGYLLLGLTAGLVMSAVETIQPGSFAPLNMLQESASGANATVLMKLNDFSQINYFAFICLTTVGLGDIQPVLPASRILAVITGIIGPLYLAVVMGVLIGRYTNQVEEKDIFKHEDRR